MQKIIYKLIREFTKGVDTYTHNGSTWLIFTDTKQWVIELTKDRTLWYNYTFFKGMFSYCSIEVVDNQHYITQWVEDNIINGSKNTPSPSQTPSCNLVEVLENGVKETSSNVMIFQSMYTEGEVEEIIENGVKETQSLGSLEVTEKEINNTIQNGVKHTEIGWHQCNKIDDTIDKGVKEIKGVPLKTDWSVEDAIKNGVRVISPMTQYADWQVKEIIENGVNKTKQCLQHVSEIENVIDNGVKETHSVSKNLFWEIGTTLQYGVKETRLEQNITEGEVEEIIENGELKTSPRNLEQFGQGYSLWKTETVINEGVKEIKRDSSPNPMGKVSEVIDNGVKETKSLSIDLKPLTNLVIDNGVKETKTMDEWVNSPRIVGEVIDNGIIETKNFNNSRFIEVGETIREGVKETKSIGGESPNYPNSIIGYVINNGVKENEKIS
jgi:hypothetical protein